MILRPHSGNFSSRFFSIRRQYMLLFASIVATVWSFERKTYTWSSRKSSHSWNPADFVRISGEIPADFIRISHMKSAGFRKGQLPGMVSPMFYLLLTSDRKRFPLIHGRTVVISIFKNLVFYNLMASTNGCKSKLWNSVLLQAGLIHCERFALE